MKNQLIYQDEHCMVTYGPTGVTEGHVKIFPRTAAKRLKDIPMQQALHLFTMAGKVASILFEGLGAQGTNIICNDGVLDQALCVHVIARFEGDGLKLQWEPKQASREELDKVEKQISAHTQYLGVAVQEEPKKETQETTIKEILEESNKEVNHLLRQLERIP